VCPPALTVALEVACKEAPERRARRMKLANGMIHLLLEGY